MTNQKINLEAMKKTTDRKGCEHYECKTCGYQTSVRAEELDSNLSGALMWLLSAADEHGIEKIPCTKAAAKRMFPRKIFHIPDYVIGSRVYPKLKYWRFVKETGQKGVWELDRKLARDFVYGNKEMCKYVYVCEDQPVGQSFETVTRLEIERMASAA